MSWFYAGGLLFVAAATSCAHDLTFLSERDGAVADASLEDTAVAPDAAAVCAAPANGEACDPVRNCNCNAPQTCAAPDLDQRRSRCVRAGSQREGAACLGAGECSAGLSCVRFTCRRACRSRSDCGAQEVCVTDDPGVRAGVCAGANECMIGAASGCAAGVHCRIEQLSTLGEAGGVGVAWCEELDGTAGEGGDCESSGCTAGLACDNLGASFRCVRQCTESAQCTGMGRSRCDTAQPIVVNGVRWGVCAP